MLEARYICALSLILALPACDGLEDCQNKLISKTVSPSGSKNVVIFERNCGATVRSNVQVSVLPINNFTNEKGNILIYDNDNTDQYLPRVAWINENQIHLSVPKEARVFLKESHIGDVSVAFD